ncbi:hypothetical protein M3J09_009387 [Ascochyta lentis]
MVARGFLSNKGGEEVLCEIKCWQTVLKQFVASDITMEIVDSN